MSHRRSQSPDVLPQFCFECFRPFSCSVFHLHWHVIFLEGGFDLDGRFLHIPFGNLEKMAQAFRQCVLGLFLELGLIDRDRAEGLLT